MPEDEYLLIENQYACGFAAEHSLRGPSKYTGGIAIWHVDETKTLRHINHKTQGHPGDGKWPYNHYRVALLQADGEYNLEKNKNRGDHLDLFKLDPKNILERSSSIAYKIGPKGITKNGGGTASHPNTNAYSTGREQHTGITITVGEVSPKMKVHVELEGVGSNPSSTLGKSRPPSSPSPFQQSSFLPRDAARALLYFGI